MASTTLWVDVQNSPKTSQCRVVQLQIPLKKTKTKRKQREKKAPIISREESFRNPKRMATDGLDLGLWSEMGLTCKHEFQSWTCVVVMKIRPPLKVKRENDLHRLPANPTSQKVNNAEEKTLANTKPQTPPLRMVKKKLSKPNPPATFSPNFSKILIRHLPSSIFHPIFSTDSM